VKSLDVAQAGKTLYYFSAGFLIFNQSDFTSGLNADRAVAETSVPRSGESYTHDGL
jgi:hypothetical protein